MAIISPIAPQSRHNRANTHLFLLHNPPVESEVGGEWGVEADDCFPDNLAFDVEALVLCVTLGGDVDEGVGIDLGGEEADLGGASGDDRFA